MNLDLELSRDEVIAAVVVAVSRRLGSERARANGGNRRELHFPDEPPDWNTEIESTLAEVAVARWRNRYWMGAYFNNGSSAGTDAGEMQVRWTAHAHGHLIIYPADADADLFVLVTGASTTKRIVGWLFAGDAKRAEWWRADARFPSWWVPQHELHGSRNENA